MTFHFNESHQYGVPNRFSRKRFFASVLFMRFLTFMNYFTVFFLFWRLLQRQRWWTFLILWATLTCRLITYFRLNFLYASHLLAWMIHFWHWSHLFGRWPSINVSHCKFELLLFASTALLSILRFYDQPWDTGLYPLSLWDPPQWDHLTDVFCKIFVDFFLENTFYFRFVRYLVELSVLKNFSFIWKAFYRKKHIVCVKKTSQKMCFTHHFV